MHNWEAMSHVKWECHYHIIFLPKYRRRTIYGPLRKEIGTILRALFEQKGAKVIQGYAMPDHVHLLVSIPPKVSVSSIVGYVKGKSAIQIHRRYLGVGRNFAGWHFWSRGYCVSSVGLDKETVRGYIRRQEVDERRERQMGLF